VLFAHQIARISRDKVAMQAPGIALSSSKPDSPVLNVAAGVGLLLGGEVGAPGGPGDLGAVHGLDGDDARERPEVGVRDPLVGGLDGLEERAGVLEAGVGAVRGLALVHRPRGHETALLTSGAKRMPAPFEPPLPGLTE
jgi:hypothetical protein